MQKILWVSEVLSAWAWSIGIDRAACPGLDYGVGSDLIIQPLETIALPFTKKLAVLCNQKKICSTKDSASWFCKCRIKTTWSITKINTCENTYRLSDVSWIVSKIFEAAKNIAVDSKTTSKNELNNMLKNFMKKCKKLMTASVKSHPITER